MLWRDSRGPGHPYIPWTPQEFARWSAAFGDLVELPLRHAFALTPEELLRARDVRVERVWTWEGEVEG